MNKEHGTLVQFVKDLPQTMNMEHGTLVQFVKDLL